MNEENMGFSSSDVPKELGITAKSGKRGKLKIFFGYASGVGKTYAMLSEARELLKSGRKVMVGYMEPGTKPETLLFMDDFNLLPPAIIRGGGAVIKEFDLDEALRQKPEVILVDTLSHENGEGARNKKRYQDVEELLTAGIDVYTTLNVCHIESFKDLVQNITKEQVKSTVPDYIFDGADMVKLIDIEPEELIKRTSAENGVKDKDGKGNTGESLRFLRELAIRKAADRISRFASEAPSDAETHAGAKFMVCIGPSPSSAKCIRWTARAAGAFHAPWCAVFVEDMRDDGLDDDEKMRISANMALAEEMGAEIVTLNGDDIATVIAGYAKLSRITNIVVGKSRNKKTLKSLFKPDFEDRLISMLPNVEVHIVPGNPQGVGFRGPKRVRVFKNITLSWRDSVKTILYLFAATLISFALKSYGVSEISIITLYILSVLVISRTTAGFFYGVAASIISVLAFNFFFTEPYFTLFTIDPDYPVIFFIMLVAALITSATTVRIKNQALIAVEREHRTGVLYEINKGLLVTRDLEKITELTNGYLLSLFERPAIFYTADPRKQEGALASSPPEDDSEFLLSDEERAAAGWAYLNCKNAGAGTDTLTGAGGFYMPIIAQGRAIGVIGIDCRNKRLTQSSRMLLQRIVSQVAMALERQKLSEEQREAQIESVREKMRANLLRAISHDLRTPLTSISGASSALIENGDHFDDASRKKLLIDIKEESLWLIRLVENILSVTRIKEYGVGISKSPEAAEEIIAEAVSRIRVRFPEAKISVNVPDELLIVPMDGTLIEQVLINLIENAIMHSGGGEIKLKLRKEGNEAVFEVIDSGEGIPEQDLPYIFESYSPDSKKSADSSRGMGIGLSICMSIVRSHNGTMTAENRKEGGAIFRFKLPLEEGNKDGK